MKHIEEIIMVLIAAAMLSYLLPSSFARNIVTTLLIAVALVVLLVLRTFAWHSEVSTPFDVLLVLGICALLAYLVSFSAFNYSVFNILTILLFAAFYILIAGFMYIFNIDEQALAQPAALSHKTYTRTASHVRTQTTDFKDGVQPITQHTPPWERSKRVLSGLFKRKLEPIPEIKTPHGNEIDRSFKKGIEPIHEITPEHLKKLGTYDVEDTQREVKKEKKSRK